ncbi:MAG TPA: hypothetical protein PKD85_01455 [Saprospiraceae bacterium]|nr:hypothetical protein [Saprospiraceae bacterium]
MFYILALGICGAAAFFYRYGKVITLAFKMFSYQELKELMYLKFQLWVLNKMDIGILKKNGDVYEVSYLDGIHTYKIIIRKKRGPSKYIRIYEDTEDSENSEVTSKDITNDIRPYAGPSHDFHGLQITPHMMGKRNVSFHMKKGEVVSFEKDDTITF